MVPCLLMVKLSVHRWMPTHGRWGCFSTQGQGGKLNNHMTLLLFVVEKKNEDLTRPLKFGVILIFLAKV